MLLRIRTSTSVGREAREVGGKEPRFGGGEGEERDLENGWRLAQGARRVLYRTYCSVIDLKLVVFLKKVRE